MSKLKLFFIASFITLNFSQASEIPSNCLSAAKLACEKALVNEDCINRMTNACYRITMIPAVKDPAYGRAVELTRLLCEKEDDFEAKMECMSKLYSEIANDIII